MRWTCALDGDMDMEIARKLEIEMAKEVELEINMEIDLATEMERESVKDEYGHGVGDGAGRDVVDGDGDENNMMTEVVLGRSMKIKIEMEMVIFKTPKTSRELRFA